MILWVILFNWLVISLAIVIIVADAPGEIKILILAMLAGALLLAFVFTRDSEAAVAGRGGNSPIYFVCEIPHFQSQTVSPEVGS